MIQATIEYLLAQVTGDINMMLQNAVIHIDDVKAAVGSVVKVHRPESFVGGGQELRFAAGILRP